MNERKHLAKKRISFSIGFLLVALIIFGIWLWISTKQNAHELIYLANIVLPYLIGTGLFFAAIQFFVLDKLYYVKLTDTSMSINTVFPSKSFPYKKIKYILFDKGWFKGVDTGSYFPWPIVMKMKNPKEFINDLKQKYKKETGKILTIKSNG